MAAKKFSTPTHAQLNTHNFGRLPLSFSHESPSFLHGHDDQGGRPHAGSVASLSCYVSPRLRGGGDSGLLHGSKKGEDGGSPGGTGWPILESSLRGVNGGGAARGAVVDGILWTCCVCSKSFHGLEALRLHMILEVLREEYLGMQGFAVIVRAAQEAVSFAANLASPAAFRRGSAGAGAGAIKSGYTCKKCGKMCKSGQALGGHMTLHRRDRDPVPLASVPAASASTSSSPPGFSTRKRPAMEEAAARGNGKRRCIRLFGVDIVVEAPKE